jgi:hypothetical protein
MIEFKNVFVNDLVDVNKLSHCFSEALYDYFKTVPKMKMMTPAEAEDIISAITGNVFEPIIDELTERSFLQRVTGTLIVD